MKKYKKILIIIGIITLIRFLISFKLSSFYIQNSIYDDRLMIYQLNSLLHGRYLGNYGDFTLIKGVIFPFFLYITRILHMSYSTMLTLLYILSCMYFTKSLDKVIKNKKALIIIYTILLFNPISMSSELFQRIYRNSLTSIEILFFLGTILRLFLSENKIKKDIFYYILLGFIISIMYMTREDNIWAVVLLIILVLYKIIKNKNYKTAFIYLIPFVLLFINLNIVSLINYNHYGIYTYNEIQKSNFKDTFKKVLEIKDDEEIHQVSIPKSTMYKLSENTKTFNVSKDIIDDFYRALADDNGEIYNGNIIWYFRQLVYKCNKLDNAKKAEKYFKDLGKEIDKLFKEKKLKKEYTFPSILLNRPTRNDIMNLPKSALDIVIYTTTYKDVKTITDFSGFKYDSKSKAYTKVHKDSHTTADIVEKNDNFYEIIRVIYMILTIILSPICLVVYFMNIKKKDELNMVNIIILISYLIILAGVTYTDVTAFPTKRYLCLGNLYILQSIFICLNVYRLIENNKLLEMISKIKKKKTSKKKSTNLKKTK